MSQQRPGPKTQFSKERKAHEFEEYFLTAELRIPRDLLRKMDAL
jgi:hypothetical protein